MDPREELLNIGRFAQSLGFVPIPVWGKVPRFRNWPDVRVDPNDTEKTIRRIGHLYDAKIANNVAIVTGEASGVVVVDVETSDVEWWKELVGLNGLPETFTVQTGTGGLHIYFKYAPPLEQLTNLNKIFSQNMDFRTNGGSVVFAGSTDVRTKRKYEIIAGYAGGKATISDMPFWLFSLLKDDQEAKHPELATTKPRAISIDIDGTIANVTARRQYSQSKHTYGSGPFWNLFLSGTLYPMDQPIEQARNFLQRYATCGQIIYLSGRPNTTINETKEWLQKNNLPDGVVLLRPYGDTQTFKTEQLRQLKESYNLEAHIGDTDDDRISAGGAGVPFVLVKENEWIPQDPVQIC